MARDAIGGGGVFPELRGDAGGQGLRRRTVHPLMCVVALAATLAHAAAAEAQSGLQQTPDGKRVLVSKDVGGQRWAITRNPDHTVTGNVFFPGGGAPQFVWCTQTGESGGDIRLTCSGADACPLGPCDAKEWLFIADVTLSGTFFGATATAASVAGLPVPSTGGVVRVQPARLFATAPDVASVAAETLQSGLQITPDGAVTLISKDVGDQRWAISRNEDGTFTGNVFFPGGGEPKFVWCESTGPAVDPVALRCFGADPCPGSSTADCTGSGWALIAEVALPASFFTARAQVSIDALVEALTAQFGEDGAFDAIVLALDRGYSLRQITRAGLSGRLQATGHINERSGAVEAPAGPPRGLFTGALANASGLITFTLADLRNALRNAGNAFGHFLVELVLELAGQGYALDQIVTHLATQGRIVLIAGVPFLVDEQNKPITPADPGDNPLFKPDPKCGDGKAEGSEQCDGNDFHTSCQILGYGGGVLKCTPQCTPDISGCSQDCGDGERAGNEVCDGDDLAGQTCVSLGQGFTGGTLTCAACAFNTSQCTKPACGNGTRDASEACEGTDLGGATCVTQGFTGGTLACSATCTLDTSGCSRGCAPGPASIATTDGTSTTASMQCDGNCIPDGADCCEGEGAYCSPGSVCVGNHQCCPTSTPQRCGNSCVAAGTQCCEGATKPCNGACIPADGSCCGNGTREDGEQCDGGDLAGATCASLGHPAGSLGCSACKFNTSDCTCDPGEVVCGNFCSAPGTTCCGSGGHCDADEVCVGSSCCPASAPTVCDNLCYPPGQVCCGGGHTCVAGKVCVEGGCCSSDHPVECGGFCYPSGSVCCGDYACNAGSQCGGNGQCH